MFAHTNASPLPEGLRAMPELFITCLEQSSMIRVKTAFLSLATDREHSSLAYSLAAGFLYS